MNLPVYNTKHRKAFSIVEMMIAISVIAILALIGIATVTKVKPAAELSKLQSDVQNLNTAVKVYKHSGGDLSTANTAGDVIAKLKTVRQKSTASQFVGFTGSMLDSRTSLVPVDPSFKGGRAVYDKSKNRFFVTTDAVPGFKIRLEDLTDPGVSPVQEVRTKSALEYAKSSKWVWDYEDVPPPSYLAPTLVTKVNIGPPTPGGPGTVEVPIGPETPMLQKLLPPTFSLPSDYYGIDTFPMPIAISNPNDAGLSKIIYGIINAENWEWLEYTGPIAVGPGDKILAFVESLKPQEFHHSDPADEQYDWRATLSSPAISLPNNEIDARTGVATVIITHSNNPDYYEYGAKHLEIGPSAFSVQYKLIPAVPGQGTETGWMTYEGPFEVGGPQFPRGFEVVSKVVSNSPNFIDSAETSSKVGAFYKLEPPVINSSPEVLSSAEQSAVITITNPNPSGTSNLVYQILNHAGVPATTWLDYSAPFTVQGRDFARGFTIAAKAAPLESYYRESDKGIRVVPVYFFGLPVTGRTIFVLDSSGSMVTNGRINRLKSSTNSVLSLLNVDDKFAIIDYDSTAKVLIGWGSGSQARKNSATAAINAMTAGGGTLYNNALLAAINLNATGADQVIFLSDGYPNDTNISAIMKSIDKLILGGVKRFDTVALGTDQAILNVMANRGGGQRIIIPD